MPGGRPTKYNPELGRKICEAIKDGWSLRQLDASPDYPSSSAICSWVLAHDEFAEIYATAQQVKVMQVIDEAVDISDDSRNDSQLDDKGQTVVNYDVIQRARLRVDTRKWLASKIVPKIYGDKITQELTGKDGAPLQPVFEIHIKDVPGSSKD
jgi:hypothetical protein